LKIIYCVSGEEILVDDEDYYLSEYSWYFHKSDGYAYRNLEHKRNSKRIQIHRDIMPCEEGFEIDHIFGNKLDNRKENLRIVPHKINARNRKIPSNNKTGYMGVWQQRNKFVAEIRKDDIKYYLGTFETALEAALAYDKKAKEFGFDHVNFKDSNVSNL
jgi:hypothetical protein